jgi:hypothetical protein
MNDANTTENPLLSGTPNSYEDAYYTDEQAQALYDVYMMLRDSGFDADELTPLAYAIAHTTVYDATAPERLHQHVDE